MRHLISCLIIFLAVPRLYAQSIEGIWEAKADKSLWVMNISNNNGRYETTLDDPEHDLYGIAATSTHLKKDSLFVDISLLISAYKAKWDQKDDIKGQLTYQGGAINLEFKRISLAEKNTLKVPFFRPQTPKPPFDYVIEDVDYHHDEMHYGATFTKPHGTGKFPTVIIVNGWVLEDRNGNMYAHKTYRVLADYLTRNGFAVLRVDSRGMGTTSLGKKRDKLTPGDVSYDLKSSLDYLKTRPDVDLDRLGLIAQGNGCIPAQIVASRDRKTVKFLVQWGAPAMDGIRRDVEPALKILKRNKVDTAVVAAYERLKIACLQVMLSADNEEGIYEAVATIFSQWKSNIPPGTISKLHRYLPDVYEYGIAKDMIQAYNTPQRRFNISYQPERFLSRLKCPMLFITGENDTETPAAENFEAIKAIADSSANKHIEMRILPGLNHLLQTTDDGRASEYIKISETIAPSAMKIITDWIKIHTK